MAAEPLDRRDTTNLGLIAPLVALLVFLFLTSLYAFCAHPDR
jgi:hypothetical protein